MLFIHRYYLSSSGLSMRYTPTINPDNLITSCKNSGLLRVVGYGSELQLILGQLKLISRNYFVMGSRDNNMKNILVPDNTHNDLRTFPPRIYFSADTIITANNISLLNDF